MTERVHHVEVFVDTDPTTHGWGWQCFTCGAQAFGFQTCMEATDASDEHEGACRCESH